MRHPLQPFRSSAQPYTQDKVATIDRIAELVNLDEFEAEHLLQSSLFTLELVERLLARVSAKKPGP